MPKPSAACFAGVAIGAACGLVFGAIVAFLHLNVRGLVVLGVALTPTISGVLLGSAVGLILGLTAAGRLSRFPK